MLCRCAGKASLLQRRQANGTPAQPTCPPLSAHRREDGGWELSIGGPSRPAAAVRFARGGAPFAAVIPGDSVAEQVITSGISSFL